MDGNAAPLTPISGSKHASQRIYMQKSITLSIKKKTDYIAQSDED